MLNTLLGLLPLFFVQACDQGKKEDDPSGSNIIYILADDLGYGI